MSPATLRRILPATAFSLLVAGCGYRFDADRGEARLDGGELPRVAVLPFDTDSYRRGIEIELTRAVADELRARSPRSPAPPDRADWLLSGTVLRADERVLSDDAEDLVRESSFWVVVEVSVRERTSGSLVAAYTIEEREPFSDRAGRVATVDQARAEALRDLAERIVYRLESEETREDR